MKNSLVMAMAVILALQGFFPETFQWPTDSTGWVRFFLGLAGVILAAVLKFPVQAEVLPKNGGIVEVKHVDGGKDK